MSAYTVRRLLYIVPSLLIASLITFTIGFYGPGDPLKQYMGEEFYYDVEARNRLRHAMGLDRPFYVQYGEFLGDLLQGDFGRSIVTQRSINKMLEGTWPKSIQLGLVAMAIWFVLGTSLGVIAAVNHNNIVDYAIVSISVALSTIPTYVLAPMLMILFILKFPIIDSTFGWDGIFSQKIILPAFVIGATGVAGLARQMRSSILETIGQDYVRTARAKGLSERMVVVRHVVRNAFTPVLTITAAAFSGFITGTMFAERIFNIRGFGSLVYEAISTLDYPLLVVLMTATAAIVMMMNVIVDILYGVLDPRVSVGQQVE